MTTREVQAALPACLDGDRCERYIDVDHGNGDVRSEACGAHATINEVHIDPSVSQYHGFQPHQHSIECSAAFYRALYRAVKASEG